MHVQNNGTKTSFAKKVLTNFSYWNREKVKKVSVLDQKTILLKKRMYFKTKGEAGKTLKTGLIHVFL